MRLPVFLSLAAVLMALGAPLLSVNTSAAQAAPPPTLERQLVAQWRALHDKLLDMAKDTLLPDAKLETRPHADSRTILDELTHVTIGLEYSTALLSGKSFDWLARERAEGQKPRSRAVMVREMEAALRANLPLVEAQPKPFLIGMLEHQAEHYGKLVSDYRLAGVVPPVSR